MFRIEFDERTLLQSKKGSVTASVFLSCDEIDFPCTGWNDFPIVIANWWLTELRNIERGEPAELRFMDGPYAARIRPVSDGLLGVEYIEERDVERLTCSSMVSREGLISSVKRFAYALESACRERGIESDDVSRLRRLLGLASDA